ncbi:hypothetical protein SETIT_7G023700v2 [Setaria italica]|uniref:Endonuclease/exonuclease/phosphatase domain-containing protein n=1 Tax=Setaria italica TaxID=4555 RepID=A0A368RRC3_SETIT|nr:hypothetical protein SETIT_7G023700v2 [Setaria italica]
MNAISWNCRGIGNSRTIRDLAGLVQKHNPKIVFLCETRQCSVKLNYLRWKLGLKNYVGVDSDGLSGGL